MQSVLQIVELTRSIRNQVAIKAKKEIEEMTSGEELVINFDCTQATESIPRWAAESGHTVTNYEEVGEAASPISNSSKFNLFSLTSTTTVLEDLSK